MGRGWGVVQSHDEQLETSQRERVPASTDVFTPRLGSPRMTFCNCFPSRNAALGLKGPSLLSQRIIRASAMNPPSEPRR
jgi:hypothetical protein